jgi:hypothetical protein
MRRFIPRWRKMTWVLLIWVALIVVWIASASGNVSDACDTPEERGVLTQEQCEAAAEVGTGLGLVGVFFIGFIGFIILGLIWIMSRPKRRTCPVCGEDVKKGRTTCPKCGHDFAAGYQAASAPAPPSGPATPAPSATQPPPTPEAPPSATPPPATPESPPS